MPADFEMEAAYLRSIILTYRKEVKDLLEEVDVHRASMRSAVVTLGFDEDKNIVEACNEIKERNDALVREVERLNKELTKRDFRPDQWEL